jgi:hypothetical protein
MIGAMAGPRGERQGRITLHAIQPGVLEGVYIGYLTARLADERLPEFQAALSRSKATHWIINTIEMNGFETRALATAKPWFEAFKAQGGRLLIVVTESAPVRMAVSALVFTMGVPLQVVSTRKEALSLLPAR